jgi:hypothetical protein
MPDDLDTKMRVLHDAFESELWGEVRRRNLPVDRVMRELNVTPKTVVKTVPAKRSIRHVALVWLAIITLLLVVLVSILALTGKAIPDVLSGFIGTGLGAFAGILVGGSLDDNGKSGDEHGP